MPGPYNNLEKGILILEHLLNGYSIEQMGIYYCNKSSFYNIYRSIYIENIDILEEWIDEKMENNFGNNITRYINSYLNNPELFQHVTLLMDGHHNKINYENINIDKKDLYSYEIKW